MEKKVESIPRLLEALKQASLKASIHELYIPLRGKHTINPDEEPFDLEESLQTFFEFKEESSSDPRVMLLLGDAGSGKSVFSQQLHHQLWKAYRSGDPIPLWISLPELECPFDGAVEEVLSKAGFSESQITDLKAKEKFIFVVDGYDELHRFQNCYVTNKWEKWKAKILITCRTQALYNKNDYEKYFIPYRGEKSLPLLLRKTYVAPFSKEQISAYVAKYRQLNAAHKIAEEDFTKIPGLTELITSPFMLHLAVEALPDILVNQAADEENKKMTQAKLYDVFIERWFTRQIAKLRETSHVKDSDQALKKQFWDYCKAMAILMHEKQVSVIPYQGPKTGGRLFGKQEQENPWEGFFNADTEIVRSACPLRRYGEHQFGFMHASFVNYFTNRAMYEAGKEENREQLLESSGHGFSAVNSAQDKEFPPSMRSPRSDTIKKQLSPSVTSKVEDQSTSQEESQLPRSQKQLRDPIHKRLFTDDPVDVRLLADRVNEEEEYKLYLLKIVEASKKSQRYAIGAANAITGLVRAGVTFNGANLSGIRIPGAVISGGYFDQSNFEGSDLRGVIAARVWLRQADLKNCQLEGMDFGEYPWFAHDESVNCIAYRPDLNRLVTASGEMVMVWNCETGDCVKELKGHSGEVRSVSMSGDGQRVASGGMDKTIHVWNLSNWTSTVLQGHEQGVTSVNLSTDGMRVVSGSEDSTVRLWEIANHKCTVLRGHEDEVNCVCFSADGMRVASGGDEGELIVWDVVTGKPLKKLRGHLGTVTSVDLSADGMRVASGSEDCTVRIWDVANRQCIVLRGHEDYVKTVHLSADGQQVVSGSGCYGAKDNTVRLWDVSSGKCIFVLRGHSGDVNSVNLSLDAQHMASGSMDNTVRVWKVACGEANVLRHHKESISSIHLTMDGQRVVLVNNIFASAPFRGDLELSPVQVLEAKSGAQVVLGKHESFVGVQRVASMGRFDKSVRIWEVASGKHTVLQAQEVVNNVHLNADGQRVATCSGKIIQIWELASGESIILQGHKDKVSGVHLSSDGKCVVSGSYDKTVRVWTVASGEFTEFRGHESWVGCVALSADGRQVASGSGDKTVRIWDVVTTKSTVLRGHDQDVTCVCLSSDGLTLFSGSWDATVRMWDVLSRSQKALFRFTSPVRCIALQDKSGLLAIGTEDGTVQLWQQKDDRDKSWLMKCSSSYPNPVFTLQDCNFTGSTGISSINQRLLEQRGAILGNKAELITQVARLSGSPLHSPRSNVENQNRTLFTENSQEHHL